MTTDGGLRALFAKHLPDGHWQSVETWSTGRGVPDVNYCLDSIEGWIECKVTEGWIVLMRPDQIAWIERRARAGGRVTIAVRRRTAAGPRKGPAIDDLYLFPSRSCRALITTEGIRSQDNDWRWTGGPAKWDWTDIRGILRR